MCAGVRSLVALALLAAFVPVEPIEAGSPSSANTLRLEEGGSSPPAAIADVDWLAGYWRGTGLGGSSEELWGQPLDGRMYGTFTLAKEDGIVFSEAMMLVEENGSLVLKVKHFTRDFVGWEEKDGHVSFPLVQLGEKEAYFNGLTFRRDEDSLKIYLVLVNNGERTEHAFDLQRVPL